MANAADEEGVKKLTEREKRGRELELSDVAFILGSEQGRRFFWRYLTLCHVFETSFTGNNTTFFNEGERNIGLIMMADLNNSCPETYIKMLQESKRRSSDHA